MIIWRESIGKPLRRCGRISLVALGLALCGCSYVTDFVFMNGTSVPARLSYVYRSATVDWQPPALGSRPKGPFEELADEDYAVNPDRTHVTVVVPPGKALRLFTLPNYPGNDLRGLEQFPLSELTVSDDGSAVTVKNERALLAFQRWNAGLYVFSAYEVVLKNREGKA